MQSRMAGYQPGQPTWASHPMPPGWEAKYDPGQGRYFYINHNTKQTTWVDPRQTAMEAANRRPAPQVPQPKQDTSYPWSVLNTGAQGAALKPSPRSSPRPSPQPSPRASMSQIPLTDMSNPWEKQVQSKYGMKVQHIKFDEDETSFQQQASPSTDRALLSKLLTEFSSADPGIVKDILSGCRNDEIMARQQMKSLGYIQVRSVPSRDVSPRPSPSRASATSPRQRSTSPKPPAPQGPSEAQKARLQEKFAKEFPGCAASVVVMALEASTYDENKTRMLLKSMAPTRSREPSPSKSKTSTPRKSTATTSATSSATSTTAYKPSEAISSLYGTSSTTARTSSPSRGVTITLTSGGPSGTTSTLSSPNKAANRKGQKTKKQVPTGANKSTKAAHSKNKSQSEYKSENRIQPKGPDSSLAKGPCLDNILDHYTVANGPNPKNRQGPLGARGHDPSLAVGANRSLLCGSGLKRTVTQNRYGQQRLVTAL